jgi:hypothetical protein
VKGLSQAILRLVVACLNRFRFASKGNPIGGTHALIPCTSWQVVNLALPGPVNLPWCCVRSLWCHFGTGPLVRMGVGSMGVDIGNVGLGEFRSLLQNKEVFRTLFFGGFRELKEPVSTVLSSITITLL